MAAWLEGQGLRVLERNYRIPGGELDIIAREPDGGIVIVEVRSRGVGQPGLPEETLSANKRSFLRRAATRWLVEQNLWERVPVRFDVVAVDTHMDPMTFELSIQDRRWIRSAFEAKPR